MLTLEHYNILKNAIKDRKNILIVGGTGSGKTTFTNAILDSIVKTHPNHRLIIIEDTAEIQCVAKNKVILRATDKVSILRLLKATMRLRPDRIIIGEVRGKEALDLLKAWNTGHPGGVATVHANSAKGGLIRMEQLISEATTANMKELIAEAIDIVVYIEKTPKNRKIKEVIEVKSFDFNSNDYLIKSL